LAVVYDYSSIIVSNEKSANFGNLNYLGLEINHQWSKSIEFEKIFQNYIHNFITKDINYSSILRQFSELEIAKKFINHPQYFPVFSSCNRNFRIDGVVQKRWCGECPKCAFNFIMFAANLPKKTVLEIFHKNLLDDPKLISLYRDLIGKGKMKPFDCVGTFEESQQALNIIIKNEEYKNDFVIKNLF
jgi:UDP-N-acetyl-alpha-D-muramoyl-L-alanyl-L-glutamate epimerase